MTVQPITLRLFKIFKMKKQLILLCIWKLLAPICLIAQVMPQGYLIGPKGMIGSQQWAQTNLYTSTFSNGESIPYYTSATTFSGLTTPASCSVNFNAANDAIYGRLYNWYAIIDSRNVCPVNWHVPDNAEFLTLSAFIGGNGNALKEIGYTHWTYGGGTDLYNFKGVGTGYMGTFSYSKLHQATYYWTKTEVSAGAVSAYTWPLIDNSSTFAQSAQGKVGGFSVRCIHD